MTVAVIDTGIDLAHPEFAGALHPAGTNIVTGDPASLQDIHGHGTAVAGVIAARRNGEATHGVAFDSLILPIRADSCPAGCGFTQSAVADATAYAVAAGAQVINFSLGGAAALSSSLHSALAAAAAQGVVLVFAAGNDGGVDPTYPARFAGTSAAAGAALAVGAVDAGNAIAAFSNRAGGTAHAFLVAPGTNITAPALGGGTLTANGTSFSAPHVAGAAAVVLDAAPHLSAPQVVELLLTTATDLGAPGPDPIYGHGLVNLKAALSPQAPLRLPIGTAVAGPAVALAATGLRWGQAFGAGAGHSQALREAILLDRYDRPYRIDLAQHMRPAPDTIDLGRWLRAPVRSRSAAVVAGGLGFSLTTTGNELVTDGLHPRHDLGTERLLGLAVTGQLDGATSFSAGRGLALGATFGAFGADDPAPSPDFLDRRALASPYVAFVERGHSLAVARDLGGGLALRVGVASDHTLASRIHPEAESTAYLAELGHRAAGGAELRLHAGELRERGSLLAATGGGALALGDGARTRFLGLSGRLPVGRGVDLLGHAALGETEPMGAGGPVLRDVSTLRSMGYGLGLTARDVLRSGGQLGLVVSRPLKVVAGQATLDVPVARTLEGQIVRKVERASLVPAGDEINLEVSYQLDLPTGGALGTSLLTRWQPGHDPTAAPEIAAGIRYRLGF